MVTGIICAVVGVVCVVIGVLNILGNVSMLHSYHIDNLKKEDIPKFGKRVGTGMIIVGVSIIISGVGMVIAELTGNESYLLYGEIVMAIGLIIGIAITLLTIKKYNKKII